MVMKSEFKELSNCSQIYSISENSVLLECDIVVGWVVSDISKENDMLIFSGHVVQGWLYHFTDIYLYFFHCHYVTHNNIMDATVSFFRFTFAWRRKQ